MQFKASSLSKPYWAPWVSVAQTYDRQMAARLSAIVLLLKLEPHFVFPELFSLTKEYAPNPIVIPNMI